MTQAQKSAAKLKQPATHSARPQWRLRLVVVAATLAVALTVGWGAYSVFQRAHGESELEELDDFESFEPLTDTTDGARQESDGAAQSAPRKFEGPSASNILPAWSGPGTESVPSTFGSPAGWIDHRSDTFQTGFSPDASARSDVPAWLIGTIEVEDFTHQSATPRRAEFAQPDGPSLY